MIETIGGGRALRVCDLCGGVDDHPRHTFAGTDTGVYAPSVDVLAKVAREAPEADVHRLIADLLDTSSREHHLDCCAAAGCPTGTCGEVMHAARGKRGAALLKHITNAKD